MTIGEKVSKFETSHDMVAEREPVLYEVFPLYIGMRDVVEENESHELVSNTSENSYNLQEEKLKLEGFIPALILNCLLKRGNYKWFKPIAKCILVASGR